MSEDVLVPCSAVYDLPYKEVIWTGHLNMISFSFQDPEARAIVDQRMYFDMGAFYKVYKPFSTPEIVLPPSSFRLLATLCIQSCLVAQLQVNFAGWI